MYWFWKSKVIKEPTSEVTMSNLYDETTFYYRFINDLSVAKEEVIIESPFITTRRLNMLKRIFQRLITKGVKVFVITRPSHEHDGDMAGQAEAGIRYFECTGVQVLLGVGGLHKNWP